MGFFYGSFQVRYNNPVLIDKEESSSPRFTVWSYDGGISVSFKPQDDIGSYKLKPGQNLLLHPRQAPQKPGIYQCLPLVTVDIQGCYQFLFRDETEEILDSILPPREWEEDGKENVNKAMGSRTRQFFKQRTNYANILNVFKKRKIKENIYTLFLKRKFK